MATSQPSDVLVPSFLVTARGPQGPVVRFQSAESGVAALAVLEREGLQEGRLILDDTAALARAIGVREAERTHSTPPAQDAVKAYASLRQHPGPVQRLLVAMNRRQLWLWSAVMAAGLLAGLRWWVIIMPLMVGAVALKLLTLGPGLMLMHERILRALEHNRGHEALSWLDRFETSLDRLKLRAMVGGIELATLRARALVTMDDDGVSPGTLEGALAELQRECDGVGVPEWFASVMRFRVYLQAQQPELARQTLVRAIEVGPPCASFFYDLALLHGLWLHELPKAREYLQRTRALPQPEVMTLALPLLEAVILVESDRWQEAQAELKRLDTLPPMMKLMMAGEAATLRCVVAGGLGDRAEARRQLSKVEPILRARKDPYWLARCRTAAAG